MVSLWRAGWKIIVATSVIVTLLAGFVFLLQFFKFLPASVSISKFPVPTWLLITGLIFIVDIIILTIVLTRTSKKTKMETILDLRYARRIVILCHEPQSTLQLKEAFQYWRSKSTVATIGEYSFDDYMKGLEKEGHITYSNGYWTASRSSLNYIQKYHADGG
ncbi:MAG: hypothetical protein PXY39_14720 [archaeon]|nr:hypothetical protein [archaeon]